MIPVSHVLAFAAVAAVLIAVPGPSVLFTVSRAVTAGRRAAMFTVVGNELGLVVQVIAVAFGAGALVQRSAEVFTAVKLAGAVYLVYLGVQAIRHRQSMATSLAGKLPPVTGGRAAGRVHGRCANPKTIVFLTIALPGSP
jgi:threonine/homoserine/homoserine lactone efflux protein